MCLILNHQSMGHCHREILFVSNTSQCRSLLLKFWRIFQLRHFVSLRFDICVLDWKRDCSLRCQQYQDTIFLRSQQYQSFTIFPSDLHYVQHFVSSVVNAMASQSKAKLWKRAMIVTWLQPFIVGIKHQALHIGPMLVLRVYVTR